MVVMGSVRSAPLFGVATSPIVPERRGGRMDTDGVMAVVRFG
jgi:hypothetical protein